MIRNMIYSIATASLLTLGAGVAYAQDKTPPDTSVRALEAPVDVRHKQLRAQRGHMMMHRSHRMPRHRTVSTSIPRH